MPVKVFSVIVAVEIDCLIAVAQLSLIAVPIATELSIFVWYIDV